MESVLKIENLKYKEILKSVTLSLEEKSFNILVGANGSGKTTLVNCIRGLIEYDGNINILNNYVNKKNNSEIYKNIGFFTEQEILLEDSVFEELLNTLINLNYEENKAKKRIYDIAKKLETTQLLFKDKSELCLYEKILISFMFSIIHEPKLIIIDNDLENLDTENKNKIFNYIKSQKKLTTLFITNNSEYFYMADSLLFFKDGKIILSGTLEEALENEKIFIKCGSNIPFNIDLSNKLMMYELLESIEDDIDKMVDEIWK